MMQTVIENVPCFVDELGDFAAVVERDTSFPAEVAHGLMRPTQERRDLFQAETTVDSQEVRGSSTNPTQLASLTGRLERIQRDTSQCRDHSQDVIGAGASRSAHLKGPVTDRARAQAERPARTSHVRLDRRSPLSRRDLSSAGEALLTDLASASRAFVAKIKIIHGYTLPTCSIRHCPLTRARTRLTDHPGRARSLAALGTFTGPMPSSNHSRPGSTLEITNSSSM
jgi:hypothetical protein